MEDARRWINGW